MEAGQGPNVGYSAKRKKVRSKTGDTVIILTPRVFFFFFYVSH
jgi:hypothetical protein